MPDKASTSTKDARLEIRISQEEKELCQRAADRDDRPLSNWIRSRLVAAAREELGEAGGSVKGKGRRAPSP
jgi:uncharacterized protein (DUF1778 family)